MKKVNIIGGGLAGSEAAYQCAKRGIQVNLYEMRDALKNKLTFAHQTDNLAELVCSNSLRSNDHMASAVGLLQYEMEKFDSIIMRAAYHAKVPAGGALAVDREIFSTFIKENLLKTGNINIIREEITKINPDEYYIIASGPLSSEELVKEILNITQSDSLHFFDAIAPIVEHSSIDFDKAWMQSRYDKGDGSDYINCPMSKDQYYEFIDDLVNADKTEFKEWEKDTPYFQGCLPIEVMAESGPKTLSFGPMKPVGLTNTHVDKENQPYAVVQLRKDNKIGTLWNIVGFQTKMKYAEQVRIFKKIPGLENAVFARLGGIHRNTFINSPSLIDTELRCKKNKNIMFAGQLTGVEGYVESSACGLVAGINMANILNGIETIKFPDETAIGSLINHITINANEDTFQPMNVNFGLFPTIPLIEINGKMKKLKNKDRKEFYCKRAKEALEKVL